MRGKENSNIIITIVVAAVTVISISLYECWWMRNLFNTTYESMELGISSSMALAELSSDKTVSLYLKYDVDSVRDTTPKILSLSAVSQIPAKQIAGITINKKEDNTLDAVLYDSLLTARLKYSGLDIPHAVRIIKDSISVSESGFTDLLSVRETQIFNHKSTLHQEVDYQLIGPRLTEYVLKRMTGIICVSVSLLIILILAFAIIIKTLHKQSALDRIKTDFARNMTHELKTPIAVAGAAADALTTYGFSEDPQKRPEYIEIIRRQLEKLSNMVEKILAATHEGQDSIQLQPSDVRIKEMLEEAADDIGLSAGKRCDISLSVSPEDLTARMDRKLMSSVISTLLDNAVKYSGNQPVINLKAYDSDGRLHIVVKDNGPGIAKEYRKHIFDKFYRIPTGDLHNVKGHGIGLHFAKTVVRKHSGTITVGGKVGEGSIFTISIPQSK